MDVQVFLVTWSINTPIDENCLCIYALHACEEQYIHALKVLRKSLSLYLAYSVLVHLDVN